ncbi:MAG: Zn-dependent exopeptidase M28, partial [Clostridiales bacterium]|nr:Zn-dependent exopeptidase M28 [Clostridiales bacterium]
IQADSAEHAADETQSDAAADVADGEAEDNGVADTVETSDKPEKKKMRVAASSKSAAEKRKLFKVIYYPVLALFVVLMLVFSIVDGAFGYSPEPYGDAYYKAVNAHIAKLAETPRSAMSPTGGQGNAIGLVAAQDYIRETLIDGGFGFKEEVKPETDDNDETGEKYNTVTDWYKSGDEKQPTVTVQTSVLAADLQGSINGGEYLVGAEIKNIIAAIPSKKQNAKSVIITVRYDSRPDTVGAADNAAFVANAMQTLIEYVKSNKSFDNDIVVVFTEDLDSSYGAYAFFGLFKGLDNVADRAIAGISLDAYGNGGTLALTDASGAGLDYLNAYTKISGSVLNSSVVADTIPSELINKNAVAAFGDIPAIQVAVLGGLDAAQSPLDTAGNISQAIVRQQSQLVKNYIEKFGNVSTAFDGEADDGTAIFSYLDGGTVAYTSVASYVIGALILALAAATIVMLALKKTFSLKNMFIALGVQLLVIVGTLIALMGAYFLVTLMLTGFGVLPLRAITTVRYFNAGILIAAMFISLAASFGFTTLFKKLFRVTSSDVVRGTAMLFGLAGAVMSFACPAYSFMTSWLGMLMLAVLLVSVCLHKKFKAKFGMGMDQLYLYAVPVALCLPLIMANVTMLMWLLPLVLIPAVMTVFTAMLGAGVPYLDRTRAMLDKVAKKLPKRTIRVERVVTEKIEDRAKKGKFTEKTFKRVEKEKVAVNYKNYFGVSVIAVLGIVIALFSGGFGVDYGKTLTGYTSYADSVYNDALVYEWEKGTGDTVTQRIVVNDLTAYKFIRYSLTDLEWDGENGRYSKTVYY